MPYIDSSLRNVLDSKLNDLIDEIESVCSLENREGIVNYCISTIVARSLKPQTGWRYKYLNRAHGTFLAAAQEFYRRLIAPYEDKCVEKYGDLNEYLDNDSP